MIIVGSNAIYLEFGGWSSEAERGVRYLSVDEVVMEPGGSIIRSDRFHFLEYAPRIVMASRGDTPLHHVPS